MNSGQKIGCAYSYLQVDLRQIQSNYQSIQRHVPQEVIPVIKGNAHGLGTVAIASALIQNCGCNVIACAQVAEAIAVREGGFSETTIMLLSGVPFHALRYVVDHRLLMSVYEEESIRRLSREVSARGMESFDVQLKIDTGLHRIGVVPEDLDRILDVIEEVGNLRVVGVLTHYANCYVKDDPFTLKQYDAFERAVARIRQRDFAPYYIHAGCSGSVMWMEDLVSTHVRVGWGYIAFTPLKSIPQYFDCHPAISLRAYITAIYRVRQGETIGYGCNCRAERPMVTATVSLGYADGFPRMAAMNHAPVLLHGRRCRCLSICMDQTFVDVTEVDCRIGDEITFFGRDLYSEECLSTAEIASYADDNPTGLHVALAPRVKRVYLFGENREKCT